MLEWTTATNKLVQNAKCIKVGVKTKTKCEREKDKEKDHLICNKIQFK